MKLEEQAKAAQLVCLAEVFCGEFYCGQIDLFGDKTDEEYRPVVEDLGHDWMPQERVVLNSTLTIVRWPRENRVVGKMNRDYFEETANEASACIKFDEQAHGFIGSSNNQLPDPVSPKAVQDALTQVARSAALTRYPFDKARWSVAATSSMLAEWLRQNDCAELIRFGD